MYHFYGLFLERWHLFLAGVLAWRAVHSGAARQQAAALANALLLGLVLILFSGKAHDMVGLLTVALILGYRVTGRSVVTEALWLVLVTVACCQFAWTFYLVFERAGLGWSKLLALHRPAPRWTVVQSADA